MTALVSFIIPHYGREPLLYQTVKSITMLDFDPSKIEIIVATKNKKLTLDYVSLNHLIQFKVLHVELDKTISYQRNQGAKASSGQFFAFIDADIDLAKDWLFELLKILRKNQKIKIISSMQKTGAEATPLEMLRVALFNSKKDKYVEFLAGSNLLLSRQTFYEVGGFPEELNTCEDYVFTQRVNDIGFLFCTSKSSHVHLGEDKYYSQMIRKEVWRSSSNLISMNGRKVPLSEWPSILVPTVFSTLFLLSIITLILQYFIISFLTFLFAFILISIYSLRLFWLSEKKSRFDTILVFYFIYFVARSLGTLKGLCR